MKRRWKPNKAQRRAYAEKMKEAEEKYTFISARGAIRVGCKVKYVDKTTNKIIDGEVVNSSYGIKTGQHTFTILQKDGNKKLVKGRNLYDRLLEHIRGERSKQEET